MAVFIGYLMLGFLVVAFPFPQYMTLNSGIFYNGTFAMVEKVKSKISSIIFVPAIS